MYSQTFTLFADTLKALAHPRRLEIIYLLKDQELCVGDMYSMLDLPQANVSQHLTVLREAKIVTSRKFGKTVCYKLADPAIFTACTLIRDFLIDRGVAKEELRLIDRAADTLLPITHDPVCQMRVSSKTSHFHQHYNNHDYYFCASGCLKKFQANPEHYLRNNV